MPAFLFEVGTEELPASFVAQASQQWRSRIPASLSEANLAAESVQVFATPRRLAVLIEGLPDRQSDRSEEIKGPPASAAFGPDGQPSKAALGFARKNGVDPSALVVRETEKGAFVFATVFTPGRSAAEILPELAPQWVLGLEGKRFMRWSDGDLRFPRPIRWLVALLDQTVLPVALTVRSATAERAAEILTADRRSAGHRVLHPAAVTITQATDYVATLRAAFVLVDPTERETAIVSQVKAAAATLKGEAELFPDLLEEVRDLVEWPTAVIGQFDREFLDIPAEVVTTVMVTHQRYFPVHKPGQPQALLPNFVTVSNGDPAKSALIAEGNGRVVRARLNDGRYFYQADLAQPLADYGPKLATVTFQDELGSMAVKVDRIVAIAQELSQALGLSAADRAIVARAAQLCKADLVTQMVFEFPELQGIMGTYYARAAKEPAAVAQAIGEHYLPKGAGDRLPESLAGKIVGLADRLDTLMSIFSLGIVPTGSSDPFALRRAANAVVNLIWALDRPLDLAAILDPTGDRWVPGTKAEGMGQQLADFLVQRVRSLLEDEQGVDYDLANAVVGDAGDSVAAARVLADPTDALVRAKLLQTLRDRGDLQPLYATINRAAKLAAKGDLPYTTLDPVGTIDPDQFEKASEPAFFAALQALLPTTQAAQADRDYPALAAALVPAASIVADFFDGPDSVLVMADDPAVRQNRLNLLALLRNHARVLADFGAIVKG